MSVTTILSARMVTRPAIDHVISRYVTFIFQTSMSAMIILSVRMVARAAIIRALSTASALADGREIPAQQVRNVETMLYYIIVHQSLMKNTE